MSPQSPFSDRPRGFTLIELLATISIIAILAVLAFAGFGPIRQKMNAATCVNNMRSTAHGVLLYANDNDGRLPPVENLKDAFGNVIPFTSFHNIVPSYLGNVSGSIGLLEVTRNLMRCPEQRKVIIQGAGIPGEKAITSIFQLRNFAYNLYLGPNKYDANNWHTLASIRNPSRTMMLTEAGLSTDFTCVGIIDTGWITQSTRGADGVLRKGVHGKYNNIAWVDGHVSAWEDISRMIKSPYRPDSTEDLWQGR